MLYTIECESGVYVSAHPTGRGCSVAHVFHQVLPALKQLGEISDRRARLTSIEDLQTWLESLLARGVTHVADHVIPAQCETWRVSALLNWLQSSGTSD